MLGRAREQGSLFQLGSLEQLVPADHLLRRIDRVLDTRWFRERVASCYAGEWGRPSVDPEVALRMILLGYLFNLSARRLCAEVQMHAGYRWFCGLNFQDPVPDHSTLSRLIHERWGPAVVAEVFRRCTQQAITAGLVRGRHLTMDGTQVRANAAIGSLEPCRPALPIRRYLEREYPPPPQTPATPEAAPPAELEDPAQACWALPEPRPARDPDFRGQRLSNRTPRSRTDPDARLLRRGVGKEATLCHLAHQIIDTRSRVILAVRATVASGDAEPRAGLEMLDWIDRQLQLPQRPAILSADKGYGSGPFLAEIVSRGLRPHIPVPGPPALEPEPRWQRAPCTLAVARQRQQRRRQVQARNLARRLTRTAGYQVSRRLRVRIEHSIAEGKQLHGLARARGRGTLKLQTQLWFMAGVQNLKRRAGFRSHGPRSVPAAMALLLRPSDLWLLPRFIACCPTFTGRSQPGFSTAF